MSQTQWTICAHVRHGDMNLDATERIDGGIGGRFSRAIADTGVMLKLGRMGLASIFIACKLFFNFL